MDDNEVMDTKKKRKNPGFWKTCLIIVVVLAAILIPLILTNPSREELSSSVPTELRDVEGRKEREVYKNYYFISTYTYTKQISTQQAEKAGFLGIAGQVIPADSGLTEFNIQHIDLDAVAVKGRTADNSSDRMLCYCWCYSEYLSGTW